MKSIYALCFKVRFRYRLTSVFIFFSLIAQAIPSNPYRRSIDMALVSHSEDIKTSVNRILPVILTPLKGYYSKGKSHLIWSSLQESNSSHYDIQRSNDGTNFYNIGKVTAIGNSDKEVDYSFYDINSPAGMNYYRLKLTDKDGGFQYSNIVALNINISGIEINAIYPAPFDNKLFIAVSSETKSKGRVEFFDNSGKLLITQEAVINKGLSNITINKLESMARGIYFIKLWIGDSFVIKKIIK